jgi:plasmid rolling circle replication initiator protein Rep
MNSLWNGYGNVADRQKLKAATNEIAEHFLSDASTMRDGFRILKCATHLRVYPDAAYGTFIDTYNCKHRQCPNCQQSKALQWRSSMHQLLDTIPETLSGKWIYLTLTTRNCHVSDLNETIKEMNNAFRRLRSRAFWKANIIGGIKFVEVDQGISDYQSAHPHFHCLI